MDAFVKAAREAFKDENIGTKELFKLMEDGKLLAKDILPLVGKNMSAAARKGGALEKMLHGNMVAMNRLRQTWQNFQNEIFMGGFGEALTKWFNQLAAMLKTNEGFAKSFGAALGNVMDQLLDKFTMIYDYILILWLEFKYYILDNIPEGIKNISGEFLAWATAIGILYKTFSSLFKILGMISGLGGLAKVLGVAGFIAQLNPIVRALIVAAGLVKFLLDLKAEADKGPKAPISVGGGNTLTQGQTSNWMNTASNYGYGQALSFTPGFKPPVTSPAYTGGRAPVNNNQSQVNIKVDEGKLKDIIKVEIQDNNMNLINLTNY